MEIGFWWVSAFVVSWFEVVGMSVVDVFSILIENLEFKEVDALLEKVYISEMF